MRRKRDPFDLNSSPVSRLAPLTFSAGQLRGRDGSAATLRGVSLFWSQWKPEFYTANAVAQLARKWKIDIIRVPIAAMAPGYLADPEGETAKAVRIIDAAISEGIFVLLDWHGHEPNTVAAIDFFKNIARKYGNSPNIIYETWNEPHPRFDWARDIAPHHLAVVRAIREYAPFALAVLGTPRYCTDLEAPAMAGPLAENIGYAVHFYAGTHREGLRHRIANAIDAGLPIFVSEWGIAEASGDGVIDQTEADRWLAFLNRHSISHINWSLCDKDEACSALRPGTAPDRSWWNTDLTRSGRYVHHYLVHEATRRSGGNGVAHWIRNKLFD